MEFKNLARNIITEAINGDVDKANLIETITLNCPMSSDDDTLSIDITLGGKLYEGVIISQQELDTLIGLMKGWYDFNEFISVYPIEE